MPNWTDSVTLLVIAALIKKLLDWAIPHTNSKAKILIGRAMTAVSPRVRKNWRQLSIALDVVMGLLGVACIAQVMLSSHPVDKEFVLFVSLNTGLIFHWNSRFWFDLEVYCQWRRSQPSRE